jgi:hypothetical protein
MWEPFKVYANGESYVFGDEMESFGMTLGGGANSSMAGDMFDSVADMNDLV